MSSQLLGKRTLNNRFVLSSSEFSIIIKHDVYFVTSHDSGYQASEKASQCKGAWERTEHPPPDYECAANHKVVIFSTSRKGCVEPQARLLLW